MSFTTIQNFKKLENYHFSESPHSAGDPGSISVGSFPGEGNGSSLHYSYLENSMDRGAWQGTARGVTKRQATARLGHKESGTTE